MAKNKRRRKNRGPGQKSAPGRARASRASVPTVPRPEQVADPEPLAMTGVEPDAPTMASDLAEDGPLTHDGEAASGAGVVLVEPVVLAPFRAVPTELVALDGRPQPLPRAQTRPAPPSRAISHRGVTAKAPRGSMRAFAQGALLGLLVLLPALAAVVHALIAAQGFALALAHTAAYAGLPAALLGGAVARAADRAAARRGSTAQRHALGVAVLGTAAVGAGLGALIAASLQHALQHPERWLWLMIAGAIIGALTGFGCCRWITSAGRAP